MTIKQKQHLLAYHGYYVGAIDGIWGSGSREACRAFQRDFFQDESKVDGICGTETEKALKHAVAYDMPAKKEESTAESVTETSGTFWDEIEFFTREEFRCQCGGRYCNGFPEEPEEKMVRTVDEIRRRLGVPVSIVDAGGSGVRCKTHNANVGGVANSEHLYGRAADLHSSASPARMKAVAEEVMGNTGGIGLYDWGIHVDTGKYSRWNG